MAKDPAFLFYSSDFLSGISDLTMEERGQYITLLCLQHQKGHLSEKTIKINIPNISNDVLSKFSKDENGNFFNKRLEIESEKRVKHSENQRNNAKKRWNKSESDGNATAYATAMPLENENENENINVIKKENKEKKFDFKKSLIDYGFSENLVVEWIQVRKNKKLTNTATSFSRFILEVEKVQKVPINEILSLCVEKSWGGFNSDWYFNLKNQNNGQNRQQSANSAIIDFLK